MSDKHPYLELVHRLDGSDWLKGDTDMFVPALLKAKFEFCNKTLEWKVVPGTSDMNALKRLQRQCKEIVLKYPRKEVICVKKRTNLHITGNTFKIKDHFFEAGGKWNPRTKAWMIPDTPAMRKLVDDLTRERNQKKKLHELEMVEAERKKQAYEDFLKTNEEKVKRVTALAFSENPERWWPLTEEDPRCYRCKIHVIWYYYEQVLKCDEDKILYEGLGLSCPVCKCDYTN